MWSRGGFGRPTPRLKPRPQAAPQKDRGVPSQESLQSDLSFVLAPNLHIHNDFLVRKQVLASLPLPCLSWDEFGVVLFVNKAVDHLFGHRTPRPGSPIAHFWSACQLPPQALDKNPDATRWTVWWTLEGAPRSINVEILPVRNLSGEEAARMAVFTESFDCLPGGHLEPLMQHLAGGYFILDAQANLIQAWGELVQSFLRVPIQEAFGQPLPEIVNAEIGIDLHSLDALKSRTVSRGLRHTGAFGAGELTVEITAIPLQGGGVLTLMRDVRQALRTDGETQLEVIGELAASAAHEIRNPLSTIRGYIQLMARSDRRSAEFGEYSAIALRELDRVNELVDDFLSLARQRPDMTEEIDLKASLQDVLIMVGLPSEEHKVDVQLEIDEALPTLRGHSHELRQMLHNLIRNALEAMPEGGTLTLKVSASASGDLIVLRVADSGVGISESHLGHIFDPFYTTKAHGTGLGLPLCQKIVEAHGGRISVESRPGSGTVFTVILPARRV